MTTQPIPVPEELESLNSITKLLDNRFRIPGTDIKFGVDFLIGLVPYAGDILSFLMSAGIILTMVRHGASGMVLLKMLWNVFLDTTVGSIPILGDIFDLQYKANRRNFYLLKEHYGQGKHEGSIWWLVILVVVVLAAMLVLMMWLIWILVSWTISTLNLPT